MPSTIIFDNPVIHSIFSIFTGWTRSETLDLVTALLIAVTLYLQSKSSEKTARIEMAKVLTEAFSHSEMFEAIDHFLQVSSNLINEDGILDQDYIKNIKGHPETRKHRYRILTTLHHAERLYNSEKGDKTLFTSLITHDIVEVTLCLYKLDDYMKDIEKPIYKMVYEVFEDIRRSYLTPYLDALNNKKEIDPKAVEHTRRILSNLQEWDRQWGNKGDRILTELQLIMSTLIQWPFLHDDSKKSLIRLDKLIKRFETKKKEILQSKKPEVFADLYFFRGASKAGLRQYEEAIKDYNKAIKLDPKYADAYYNRGVAKANLQQPQYTKAIKDYNKAIKLNSNFVLAYNNRGVVKANLEQYKEAIEDFDKAIEIDPNYADAHNNLKLAYQERE
jgi:tetratricopeptide (TPR) repeat protein